MKSHERDALFGLIRNTAKLVRQILPMFPWLKDPTRDLGSLHASSPISFSDPIELVGLISTNPQPLADVEFKGIGTFAG